MSWIGTRAVDFLTKADYKSPPELTLVLVENFFTYINAFGGLMNPSEKPKRSLKRK